MYSTILSGAFWGIHAYLVMVEVDIAPGLPGFCMVGSLSGEVRESKERVQVALKNVGMNIPPMHITVNLSPADQRKEGTAFDLPIAVGMLEALEYFPKGKSEKILFLGELGLNGEIRRVRGVLPMVQAAAKNGVKECIVPMENAAEGAVIPGITVRGAENIGEVLKFLRAPTEKKEEILPASCVDVNGLFAENERYNASDFSEVRGQETAKRAAEIAAAGFHSLLMTGPPGAGKSLIAKRIPGILPPLTLEESLEVSTIASVAGLMRDKPLVLTRPYISPHHTISMAAMTGGSCSPKPGVISLAHRGVLFLDELPEFPRAVLDCMRQPMEEHEVHISRVNTNVSYPANFMLVCAMNPCPCGYYPNVNRCKCTELQVKRYLGKISGPILDRIDLCVELQPVDVKKLQMKKKRDNAENSNAIRERVMEARKMQVRRFAGSRYQFNADIEGADMEEFCPLGKKEKECMEQLYRSLQLGARSYHRICKVARTIADLAGAEHIGEKHLMEAACFRPTQDYWNM